MSAFTPEQWAIAGEFSFREAMREYGMEPTDAQVIEARIAAVQIACGDDPDAEELR